MQLSFPFYTLIAAGVLLLPATQSESPTSKTTRPTQASDSSKTANRADGLFASWLLVDSNNEVALAQLAQQRAQDPEVKKFAQMMMDDHRAMGTKLQAFASGGGDSSMDAGSESKAVEASSRGGASGELDHLSLVRELGQQCLQTAKTELEQKSGPMFDRCYVGMMIGEHLHANDMLTVFQKHASEPLKSAMADGQKTVMMHLQQAKELAKKMEASSMRSGDDIGKK